MSTGKLTPGDLMSFLVATQTIQRSIAQMSLLFGHFVRGDKAANGAVDSNTVHPFLSSHNLRYIYKWSLWLTVFITHFILQFFGGCKHHVIIGFCCCMITCDPIIPIIYPWRCGKVLSPATEEIRAMGREIESRQGVGW
jgi:hypothetical protein